MDQDFARKVKGHKRRKKALIFVIVAVIAAVIVVPLLRRMREGSPVLVTVEIRCDELSSDLSKLKDKNLLDYVPKDGTILPKQTIEIESGMTVLDALDQACKSNDIQIEYSYTPAYDSYYVEGINYLYEFNGGRYSGWSYEVNRESPMVGCSQYKLKGGEEILWTYTCSLSKGAEKGK